MHSLIAIAIMGILNFNNWLLNEQAAKGAMRSTIAKTQTDDPANNKYTLAHKSEFVYRISSDNKWQYQKVNTSRKDVWHWVLNVESVKALNKKYEKDLKVFTHIEAKELTDPEKIKIVEAIKSEGKSLGWTNNAIAVFVGNVGRENNFNWKYIVGPHNDPKNKATNFGIISWQGNRLKNVQAALKEAGLLQDNGSAKKDVASVKAMVRFADKEMNSQRGDSSLMRKQGASTKEIADMLHSYIRYSKNPPYNEPDSRFNVKKNHYWAASAKIAGIINYV